jgi:hypothetical protein
MSDFGNMPTVDAARQQSKNTAEVKITNGWQCKARNTEHRRDSDPQSEFEILAILRGSKNQRGSSDSGRVGCQATLSRLGERRCGLALISAQLITLSALRYIDGDDEEADHERMGEQVK